MKNECKKFVGAIENAKPYSFCAFKSISSVCSSVRLPNDFLKKNSITDVRNLQIFLDTNAVNLCTVSLKTTDNKYAQRNIPTPKTITHKKYKSGFTPNTYS